MMQRRALTPAGHPIIFVSAQFCPRRTNLTRLRNLRPAVFLFSDCSKQTSRAQQMAPEKNRFTNEASGFHGDEEPVNVWV